MDVQKCKDCPYHSTYFHGFGVGSITFSHRCWWTLKEPSKIKEEECKRFQADRKGAEQ